VKVALQAAKERLGKKESTL